MILKILATSSFLTRKASLLDESGIIIWRMPSFFMNSSYSVEYGPGTSVTIVVRVRFAKYAKSSFFGNPLRKILFEKTLPKFRGGIKFREDGIVGDVN